MGIEEKLHVLTVCNKAYIGLDNLVHSLKHHKWNPDNIHVIGHGEQWGGWQWRTQKYLTKLKELHTSASGDDQGDHIYILVDASDVIFTQSPQVFYTQYQELKQKYNQPLIVSAEIPCNLGTAEIKNFYQNINPSGKLSEYKYPCHGSMCGDSKSLIHLLTTNLDALDDQDGIQEKYMNGTLKYTIDHDTVLTGTIAPLNCVLNFNNYWRWNNLDHLYENAQNYNRPVIFHFPGRWPGFYNNWIQKYYPFAPFQKRSMMEMKPRAPRDWLIFIVLCFLVIGILFVVVKFVMKSFSLTTKRKDQNVSNKKLEIVDSGSSGTESDK